MSDQLHYFMFSFVGGIEGNSGISYARVTIGWPDQKVTESRIKEAKVGAFGFDKQDATPMAVSYLGHMTPEEVKS